MQYSPPPSYVNLSFPEPPPAFSPVDPLAPNKKFITYDDVQKEMEKMEKKKEMKEMEEMDEAEELPQKEKDDLDITSISSSCSSDDGDPNPWFLRPQLFGRPAMKIAAHHLSFLALVCGICLWVGYGAKCFSPISSSYSVDIIFIRRILLCIGLIPLPFFGMALIGLKARQPNFLVPLVFLYSLTFTGLIVALVFCILDTARSLAHDKVTDYIFSVGPLCISMWLVWYTQHGCRVMMRARLDMALLPAPKFSSCSSSPYLAVERDMRVESRTGHATPVLDSDNHSKLPDPIPV